MLRQRHQKAWEKLVGRPVDEAASRQLFIGHYACAEAHTEARGLPWSWKIVCGANPAYDAFPAQHQIFYPSERSKSSLWYDPVFKVETLDGRQVWTKRHYRCTPRAVAADLARWRPLLARWRGPLLARAGRGRGWRIATRARAVGAVS